MIYVIDDNNFFISTLLTKMEKTFKLIDLYSFNNNPNKSIKKIKDVIQKSDIILINCELIIQKKKRLDFAGIEFLKILRLRDVTNNCILYSFLTLTQLVKLNPLNSIVLSKGTSFIQLPFDVLELDLYLSSEEIAEKENLLPFFRLEVDFHKVRHELANYWGAIRLSELLDIETSQKVNFDIELIKYLTPIEKRARYEKNILESKMSNFNPYKKKIFYYDDNSEIWDAGLNKLFGSKNVNTYNPRTTSKYDLFKYITTIKPGCLLLDLRLENEKDSKNVLDYSGGKLLIEIKQKYHSLPVIMFTASNKAESVRQLMAAGADYVWTKEGVDDGIDNVFTLNNTINLINEVSKCVSKFKNETYEIIYNIETELTKIDSFDIDLLNRFSKKELLKNIKTIIIDTNFLIDSIDKGYLNIFYTLLLTIKQYNAVFNKNLKMVIHSDVLWEIFRISKQDENKENPDPQKYRNNAYRVPVCRFLNKKLIEWKDQNLFWEEHQYGVENIMIHGSSLTIPTLSTIEYEPTPQQKKTSFINHVLNYFRKSEVERFMFFHNLIDEANTKIQKLNEDLNPIRDLVNLKLDADTTFVNTVPLAFECGDVIFTSNDKGCSYMVGRIFDSDEFVDKVYIPYNDRSLLITASRVVDENTGMRFTYYRYNNTEFTNLLQNGNPNLSINKSS